MIKGYLNILNVYSGWELIYSIIFWRLSMCSVDLKIGTFCPRYCWYYIVKSREHADYLGRYSLVRNRGSYFSGAGKFKYLLLVLVLLVVADGLITNFLVVGGLAREGNPFLKSAVGDTNFLILKASGALLCALILWDIYKRWPKLALISICCFIASYAGIVLWNVGLFFFSV